MSGAKPDIRIDRLALDLPGFGPNDAAPLARLVASHLAQAGMAGDIAIPRLRIVLDTAATSLDEIARRIAAAVLQGG